jgi:hypothetical protein
LLLGVSFVLRPGENPLKYLSPIVKKYLNENNQSQWFKEAGQFGRNIISLPKLIRDTVEQFQTGNSSLKTPDIWRSAKLLYLLGQQFALIIFTFSLLYLAMKDYNGVLGYNISTLFFTLSFLLDPISHFFNLSNFSAHNKLMSLVESFIIFCLYLSFSAFFFSSSN